MHNSYHICKNIDYIYYDPYQNNKYLATSDLVINVQEPTKLQWLWKQWLFHNWIQTNNNLHVSLYLRTTQGQGSIRYYWRLNIYLYC